MTRFIISILLICISIPVFSQKVIEFKLLELKEKNDSLNISYKVRIGKGAVKRSQGFYIYPKLQSGDSIISLPRISVLGKNKQKTLSRFTKQKMKDFVHASISNDVYPIYNVKIPYAFWMDTASFIIKQEVTEYRNSITQVTYDLKNKVELSPREPYVVKPTISLNVPQKEVKMRKRQGKAYLDFQVGRSVILPTFRRNPEELSKINEAIRNVITNQDILIKGLYIEGYASPDGNYNTNNRLSRERAIALKEYIRTNFNLSEDLFKVTSVAEDWQGVESLLKDSNIPKKDRIQQIISTISSFDDRKRAIIHLDKGISFKMMLKDIFPELRRVEYQIDYIVKDYDIKQTVSLLDKNPEDLSQLELYNLAISYEPNSKEYKRIMLDIIPRYFSEDETANNNTAAILIKNGELATAKRLLTKAGNSVAALNNKGIIFMLENDLDKAEDCFTKAKNLGNNDAEANLKELKIKRADNIKQERYKKR